jgi:DNA-binding transcriptional ArsR family regulator
VSVNLVEDFDAAPEAAAHLYLVESHSGKGPDIRAGSRVHRARRNLGFDLSIGMRYRRPNRRGTRGYRDDMLAAQTGPLPNPAAVDGIFRALADPTRRSVIERLSARQASVSELAAPYEMALPSFMEHLKVLETCGLVRSRKQGRVRTYQVASEQLKLAEDWLGKQRTLWERRLDRLDNYLLSLKEESSE